MARQVVVLALLLIALVGLVSADNATPKTAAAPANDDDTIGNTDEAGAPTSGAGAGADGTAVEGPIGSEEAAKSAAAGQPPTSGATTVGVSAVAGAAAIAGYFVF
ncbi:hypothetical protein DITRI_Ditri17bG0073400 [Diplodiscus trichospermus]